MLLVDDHEAEVGHGGEDRRAGTDYETLLPPAQPPPGVVALAGGELAVHYRHLRAEVGGEAAHHLPGQGDFGDQDNDPPPLLQGPGRRPDIDQRLPTAGDPLQEGGVEAPLVEYFALENPFFHQLFQDHSKFLRIYRIPWLYACQMKFHILRTQQVFPLMLNCTLHISFFSFLRINSYNKYCAI